MKTVGLSMICAGLAFLLLSFLLSEIDVDVGNCIGYQYSIKHNWYGSNHAFLKSPPI
ncbi:hypothetical protein [Bacillus subtilis]|uniref:hypothetical protein n=1 Tax=Bacillus subtilis TaxID=1423 RepID=UPI002DBA1FF2|nr:hypothetical protein [Bacillus subtilis]MEC1257031.1 hypothetical protein [Bacillus subtilis]MEC1313213.1 hypothetical protein [Bacillus subtilis]